MAVTVADAAAARHQRVLVGDVRVGVERDRRDLVGAAACLLVERLDVAQDVLDLEPPVSSLPLARP
jgi:hypothetical protein